MQALCLLTHSQEDTVMRKLIMLMLLAIPLMAGGALAASDTGIVNSVNTRTGILQLSDGATYYVPNRLPLSRLKAGDEVRIQYERRKGGSVASDVETTGRSDVDSTVVSPVSRARVRNNFGVDSGMCKATADRSNPCYIGAQ